MMSLDAQDTELTKIAERDGIQIVKTLHESMSAKAPGRPLFAEMLDLLSQGKADTILCWKLDRLARNPIDGGSISWLLQTNQIKLIKTHDRDYLPTDNVLMMSVEFGMSNQYIRDLSENVKRGNREKLRRGEWPNHAPYGYRNDKNTKTLVIHEKEATNVRRIYEMYETNLYSYGDIAKELNVRKSLVERILHKTFYYGLMERHNEYFPGKHEPIITQSLYDRVKNVREGTTRPRLQTLFFPYRGLMVCANCGCQLTATKKKGVYDYYYCTNGKGVCDQHTTYLTNSETTDFFIGALEKIRFDEDLVELMYQARREKSKISEFDAEKATADLQLELQQLERSERKLLSSYTSEFIDETIYGEEAKKYKLHKINIQKKIHQYSDKKQNPLITLEPIKNVFLESNQAVLKFKNSKPEQRNLILNEILWNLSVKDKKVAQYKYRTYYDILANAPKSGDLATLLTVTVMNLCDETPQHI